MPRIRPLMNYPHERYSALIRRISADRKAITLPGSRPQSMAIRADFYAFRRAAMENQGQARSLGIPLEEMLDLQLTVTDEGLVFRHKEDSLAAKAIDAALGALGEVIPPAAPAPVSAETPFDRAVDEAFESPTRDVTYEEAQESVARLLAGMEGKNGPKV